MIWDCTNSANRTALRRPQSDANHSDKRTFQLNSKVSSKWSNSDARAHSHSVCTLDVSIGWIFVCRKTLSKSRLASPKPRRTFSISYSQVPTPSAVCVIMSRSKSETLTIFSLFFWSSAASILARDRNESNYFRDSRFFAIPSNPFICAAKRCSTSIGIASHLWFNRMCWCRCSRW